jgi:hypothetical protein
MAVGRSEMSFGAGRFVNPLSDYQSQRVLPWTVSEDSRDLELKYRKQQRTDPTNADENLDDMIHEYGNPDMFGPASPLVQEGIMNPPVSYKQPVLRYGVDRQE